MDVIIILKMISKMKSNSGFINQSSLKNIYAKLCMNLIVDLMILKSLLTT